MLGEINWPALGNYTVQQQDLSDMQTSCFDQVRKLLSEKWDIGVMSGCQVVPGTGLDVKVKAGLILLPDGKIAYLENETVVALEAADAANPRIDRIEAEFTLDNDRTGMNEENQSVVVVKLHKIALSSKSGIAAASPVAPARSSGKVSLGFVTVAPLSSSVSSASIEQSIKSRDFSKEKSHTISSSLNNAQAAFVTLKDINIDKTKHRQVIFEGTLYRKDATPKSKTAWVRLVFNLNIQSDSWIFIPSIEGEDGHGVTFDFDQATQEVKYKTTDFVGGDYVGEIFLSQKTIAR